MNSTNLASGVFFIRFVVSWAHRGSYMFFTEETAVQPLESPDPFHIQTLYFESRLRCGGNKSNYQESN